MRALPSSTTPHVPAAARHGFATAMAQALEALAEGGTDQLLELGRTKLLMSPTPRGLDFRTELGHRLGLWNSGSLEALLSRVEAQALERARTQTSKPSDGRQRARRARTLAREGVYRKAIGSLSDSVAQLSPAAEEKWAAELLPGSRDPAAALAAGATQAGASGASQAEQPPSGTGAPDAGGQQEPPESGGGVSRGQAGAGAGRGLRSHALRGVLFPALSAAGPSGMRPEHLKEALMVRNRATHKRLLRAVAKLGDLGGAGELPDEARWILDSRVVFLKKPGTDTPRPIRIGEVWRRLVAKTLIADTRE